MRKLFFLIIVICGVMLTGCAQLIDMSDQESDVLAEYMAGTVLRHADNYEEALIYPEQTTETKESTDTAENPEMTKTPGTTETSDIKNNTLEGRSNEVPGMAETSEDLDNSKIISLASLFQDVLNSKFSINYEGYNLYESYPEENEFFTLEATKDKRLVTVTLNVNNITKKNQTLDLKKFNLNYQLTNNEDIVYNPMLTLLNNDIQYINLGIAAGKTQKAVILFEVPKNIDMSKMMLTITYKDKTSLLDLNQ
ncbi:MAG: DUF4352 domain-containing protein [Anaerocolumna sp.]